MPEFTLPGWQDAAKALKDKTLGDATLPSRLLSATAAHDVPFKLEAFTFSLRPEAAATVLVFNSKDDLQDDPMDGIIGSDDKASGLGPQLLFNDKHAWLAYHVTAGVKAEGGADLGALGLHIEGEKVVELCGYFRHTNRSQKIRDAIAQDVQPLRSALKAADLASLAEGEALAYRVRGKLSTKIEVSFADTLTANLNGLSAFLRTNTPLAITCKLGANLEFSASITDSFLVVFTRASKTEVRVAVKKGKVSSLAASGGVGIEAHLLSPETLAGGVKEILEGIAGDTVDTIDKLLKKKVVANLTNPEKSVLGRLLQRLKLDDNVTELASLRTHWETLKKEVSKEVTARVNTKVAAAFRYEYSRIRSESTLLQVRMPETVLATKGSGNLHLALLKNDLAPVIEWCRKTNVTPEKYLHEQALTVKKAWGLSISLGKVSIGGKDIETLESIKRTNFDGDEQVTFLGQRGYKGSWVGQQVSWMADLQAGMTTFATTPRLSDVELGFTFKWVWQEKKLSEEEIATYLDYADIWRATNSGSVARDALLRLRNKTATISLEVKIDDFAVRELVKAANGASSERMAQAMAKAMPWHTFNARAIAERRTRLYTRLWATYFDDPSRSYREYAAIARNTLQQSDEGVEVAFLEGEIPTHAATTAWPVSFAEMLRLNGTSNTNLSGIHTDWQRFHKAVRTLHDGIAANAAPDHLKGVFKDFCPLWSQSLQLRAVGVYWIDLAAELGLLGHVERTLTLDVQKELLQVKIGVPSR
jgi:hypothetical protein